MSLFFFFILLISIFFTLLKTKTFLFYFLIIEILISIIIFCFILVSLKNNDFLILSFILIITAVNAAELSLGLSLLIIYFNKRNNIFFHFKFNNKQNNFFLKT